MKIAAVAALLCAFASFADTSIINRRLEPKQTVAKALFEAGLDEPSVETACAALKTVFDLRHARPAISCA